MTATRHATLPIAAAIVASCAIAPSAAATPSVIVTPTHAIETVDGIARAFTGEQASATTIDWLQATLTVPATTIGSASAWVMASGSAPNPYGATWSQVGWVANGYTPRLFTQTYNGATVTTTYYGTLPPTVTVAESCNFGTGVFTTWLWYGGWLALSSSQPGQSCGNQPLTWSVEVEMDGSAPSIAPPPPPSVAFTNVIADQLGSEMTWPSMPGYADAGSIVPTVLPPEQQYPEVGVPETMQAALAAWYAKDPTGAAQVAYRQAVIAAMEGAS